MRSLSELPVKLLRRATNRTSHIFNSPPTAAAQTARRFPRACALRDTDDVERRGRGNALLLLLLFCVFEGGDAR